MMQVYTPQAWLSVFGGSPSLVIDDQGYIYSADGYYKIFSDSPIGKMDFEKGFIYDKHYLDLFATPIAQMERKGDVLEIREYGKVFTSPILYIQNNKIYTPEEYFRIFGGSPSGYIKHQDGGSNSTSAGYSCNNSTSTTSGSSGGGCGLSGIFVIPMFALLMGLIYILSDEGRLANATSVLALVVLAVVAVVDVVRLMMGKVHFEFNGKHFGKYLLIGFGVYFALTALFVLLGLGSNLGSGNSLSDAGGDQMELSALLIGLTFVLEGFLLPGQKQKSAPSYTPPKQTYTPAKQTYTPPQQTYVPAKEMLRRVMIQEYGERAVFPDALIGRNTADQVDFLLRVEGRPVRVFMILPDSATPQAYQNARRIGMLWQNRGVYWHIVYERDCRDPAYIRQWLRSAVNG